MGLYEDILKQQEAQRQNQLLLDTERQNLDANRQPGALEFLGQTLWGGMSALSMGGLDLHDMYTEANEPGEKTWEDIISLGGPREWEDLSNWGKAGYTLGTAVGMLPTFWVGGSAAKGVVKGGAKVAGNVGVKSLKKQASKELLEKASTIASQHGDEVVETIGKQADTIMDDVYKLAGEGSVADDIGKQMGGEWYQQVATADIAQSLAKALPLDQKVANELASEAFEIFTRNNPTDASNMMRAMVRRIPGLDNRAGKIAGAMAYESMIGLNMGLLRAGTNNLQRWATGYQGPDQYGFKPEGSYWLDTMHHGLSEGAWFSVIGPVKFIKGGKEKALWRKGKEVFTGMYRAMRPAGRTVENWGSLSSAQAEKMLKSGLAHKELQHTLTAMDIIQGGTLNATLGDKWASKGFMWWKDAVEGEGTNEMKKFLNEARMTFLKRAPIDLAKEFGREMWSSAPRMGMGVLAMNAHGLFEYYNQGGDGLPFNAMGRDPQEIIGNIMTAAFFTRRPHSFHDNKPMRFFETGKIDSYFDGKASELSKTTDALLTMIKHYDGSRLEALERITAKYASSAPTGSERAKNITNHSIASSKEITELKEILTPFILREGEIRETGKGRFTNIEDAVNDYVAKNFAEKGQEGKRDQLMEQLFIAKKIIDLNNNHTFEQLDMKNITSDQAVELVQKISKINFGDRPLQYENILERVPEWIMESISKNTVEPMGISKRFIKGIYDALGIEYLDEKGVITAPRIHDVQGMHFNDSLLLEALTTVYKNGIKSGWIREGRSVELPELNAEKLLQSKSIWDNSINELMQYTYGEGWIDKGIERDISILQNDAWYHTYRNIADIQQANAARALLTGDSKHNMDPVESKRLTQALSELLFTSENPGIEYKSEAGSGVETAERAELNKFIERLHAGVKSLNPQISKKVGRPLTEEQAKEFKNKIEQLAGDTFSVEESFRFFERFSFEKSVQRLGLSDMRVGFDTKAALIELYNNPDINFGDSGQLVFPALKNIKNVLNAAVASKELSKEAAQEYIKFYGDLSQSVREAGVGLVKFSDQVNQTETGQWASALKMAKIKALSNIGGMITKEGSLTANYAFQAVQSLDMKRRLIAHAILEMSDTRMVESQQDVLNLYDRSKRVLQNLGAELKEAIDSNDAITLHAWSSKMKTARELIKNIEMADESTRSDYLQQLIDLKNDALSKINRNSWNQTTVDDLVSQKLRNTSGNIPGKDVTDSALRTTLAQFSLRYGINATELNDIFSPATEAKINAETIKALGKEFLTDYYDNLGGIQNVDLRVRVENVISTLDKLSGQIEMNGDTFHKLVYEPLKTRIMIDRNISELAGEKLKINFETVESDLYSISSSFFSTRPIKHLQIDLASGRLLQTSKPLGYTPDRGITGVINALEGMGEGQKYIYILNNDVFMADGKVKNLLTGRDRKFIETELKTKDLPIEDVQGKAEFYTIGARDKIIDVNHSEPSLTREYKILNLDEKTSVLVRMDNGGIKRNIAAAFDSGISVNDGGHLYKRLQAIMASEGRTIDSNPRLRQFIESIQDASRMNDQLAGDAILMTRMILDMPSFVEKSLDQYGRLNVESAEFKERWKRLGMTHSKNGYIGTPQNLEKTAAFYKNAESPFLSNIYKAVKKWVEPKNGKYKKIKVLSINDEATYNDGNLRNIFNSIDRAKVEVDRRLSEGEIDNYTRDYMLRRYEEISKSIMDGEMFVSKDVLLASMAMRGVTREMVDYNERTGKITGFKSGALKPTVTHVDVAWQDPFARNYGEVTEWYGKTAFKYAPELDKIMKMYKVDAITFKSANKINEHKASKDAPWDVDVDGKSTRYATPQGIDKGNVDIINGSVVDFLGKGDINLEVTSQSITDIPFSSINLRSISREHPPMVGNNTAVHMRDNNGLAEWIGLDRKIDALSYGFQNQATDIFFRTELANKVFGAAAESGDNSAVRTGIESVLSRNGLLTDPWMQKRLEENLINYYMNNGNIGSGIVPDGSIDVMSADLGNLSIPIRSRFQVGGKDIRSVQFFGEFQMSHYGGQRAFELYGEGRGNIQSAIIQKIKYQTDAFSVDYNGTRSEKAIDYRVADAFVTTTSTGEKYLIVEGMAIDKSGRLLDLDNIESNKPIFGPTKDTAPQRRPSTRQAEMEIRNKIVYDDAVKQQDAIIEGAKGKGLTTMSEYASELYTWGKENDRDVSLGVLNSRQPRNMIGDIVINKVKVFEKGNNIIATVDKRSGNISRMNHVDAINPQDADYDMDKSFSYTAAHGNFWMEAGRLAGYDLTRGHHIAIAEDFATRFNSAIPEMLRSAEISHEEAVAQGNMHRGMFVKMHQTATYLANIFREDPTVMTFKGDIIGVGKGELYQVRLKPGANYISTIDNIADWSKKYIDLYKNALSKNEMDRARDIQYDILFGKDGLFEIHSQTGLLPDVQHLGHNSAAPIREAIIKRLILPVNRYLKMNQGVTADSYGTERKARLSDYNNSYFRMINAIDPNRAYAGVPSFGEGMDMQAGLRAASSFFANSKAPFDVAMKNLHQIYDQMYHIRSESRKPRVLDPVNDILNYIDEGFMGNSAEWKAADAVQRQVLINDVYRRSLIDFVKDQERALTLSDMAGRLKSLDLQIEDAERFGKTDQLLERRSYQDLLAKRNRLLEAKTILESALTTQWGDAIEVGMDIKKHSGYGESKYEHRSFKPMVIVDSKTKKVKEVILPGKRNFQEIYKNDVMIENGRRFEITDPLEQEGLRMVWERFGGLPGMTDKSGKRFVIDRNLNETVIMPAVNRIYARTIEVRENLLNENRLSNTEMARERISIIADELARNTDIVNAINPETADLYRWGIVSRLLSPRVDNSVISMRNIVGNQGRRAVFDAKFIESKFAEPIYSLLSSVENGSFLTSGMDKATAREILDNINIQKKIGAVSSKNKFIDLELLESRYFTEPADIQQGYLSSGMHLDKSVFEQLQHQNQNIRRAAEIMVDYARGNRLLDGVTLYKASRELTKAGVPIDRQMVRSKWEQLEDGTGKVYGERIRSISELDSAPMRKWGNNGALNESVSKRTRELYKCYLEGQ